jgi:serine/threonine protein kinase
LQPERAQTLLAALVWAGDSEPIISLAQTSNCLPVEYASHGNIRAYLENHPADEKRRVRWALQVAEALDFVHQCGVIHGDVNGFNVLLDRRLDAKLADFAGSSIDGSPLLIGVTASHEYPGPLMSTQADIFALGSTLYEVMTESRRYIGLSDNAIHYRYSKGKFPETESLGTIGSIITKCWRGEYSECGQVVHDLKGEILRRRRQSSGERTTDVSKAARHRLLASRPDSPQRGIYISVNAAIVFAAVAVVAASALIKLSRSRGHQAS